MKAVSYTWKFIKHEQYQAHGHAKWLYIYSRQVATLIVCKDCFYR